MNILRSVGILRKNSGSKSSSKEDSSPSQSSAENSVAEPEKEQSEPAPASDQKEDDVKPEDPQVNSSSKSVDPINEELSTVEANKTLSEEAPTLEGEKVSNLEVEEAPNLGVEDASNLEAEDASKREIPDPEPITTAATEDRSEETEETETTENSESFEPADDKPREVEEKYTTPPSTTEQIEEMTVEGEDSNFDQQEPEDPSPKTGSDDKSVLPKNKVPEMKSQWTSGSSDEEKEDVIPPHERQTEVCHPNKASRARRDQEKRAGLKARRGQEKRTGLKARPSQEKKSGWTSGSSSEGSSDEEEEENNEEFKEENKELDDDEIKTNPAFIPKSGLFYMHDVRSGNEPDEHGEETITADEVKQERQTRADVNKWTHDLYNEQRQAPKSGRELSKVYGYDIRNENGDNDHPSSPSSSFSRGKNPNFGNRRRQNSHQDSRSAYQYRESDRPEKYEGNRDFNRQRYRRNDDRRPEYEKAHSSTRGHVRTFTATNRQRHDNHDNRGDRPQRRQDDQRSSNYHRQTDSNRRHEGPRSSTEFRNLNDAQPLPKREPRNARDNQRRQNGNQEGGYRQRQEERRGSPEEVDNEQRTRPNTRPNTRSIQQASVSNRGNMPSYQDPLMQQPVVSMTPQPIIPQMMPNSFRQPTNTVYYQPSGETQQPYQNLAHRERHPLKITAPSR